MKLTKGIISRDAALALCPDYVAFVKGDWDRMHTICKPFWWNYDSTDRNGCPTHGLKQGQEAITFHEGQFVQVKISGIQQPHHEADGPVVRVSNGEYSWRVDGDKFAYVFPIGTKQCRAVVDQALRA